MHTLGATCGRRRGEHERSGDSSRVSSLGEFSTWGRGQEHVGRKSEVGATGGVGGWCTCWLVCVLCVRQLSTGLYFQSNQCHGMVYRCPVAECDRRTGPYELTESRSARSVNETTDRTTECPDNRPSYEQTSLAETCVRLH